MRNDNPMNRGIRCFALLALAFLGMLCCEYVGGCAGPCADTDGACDQILIEAAPNQSVPTTGFLEVSYLDENCQVLEKLGVPSSISALPVRMELRHKKGFDQSAVRHRIIVLRDPQDPQKSLLYQGLDSSSVQLGVPAKLHEESVELGGNLALEPMARGNRLAVLPGLGAAGKVLGVVVVEKEGQLVRVAILATDPAGKLGVQRLLDSPGGINPEAFAITQKGPDIIPFYVDFLGTKAAELSSLPSPPSPECWGPAHGHQLSYDPQQYLHSYMLPGKENLSPSVLWVSGNAELRLTAVDTPYCELQPLLNSTNANFIHHAVAGTFRSGQHGIVASIEFNQKSQLWSCVFDAKATCSPVSPANELTQKPSLLALGDVDRDSNADIVFIDGQNVYVQDGPLSQMMSTPRDLKFALGAMPTQMNLSDVNGDAILDLIVLRESGIAVYLGHGNGDFQKSAWVDNVVAGDLALADLDRSCQPGLVFIQGKEVRLLSHPSGR